MELGCDLLHPASVTAKGLSAAQAKGYRDGAWGSAPAGVFRVAVTPNETNLAARLYVGDSYTNWAGITLTVEGNTGAPVAVNTSATPFGAYTLTGSDLNGDGRVDLAVAKANTSTVAVMLNASGLCTVPSVRGKRLAEAARALRRSGCDRGRVRRAHSNRVKAGRVISQSPGPGAVRPHGTKVDLVVSRG